MKHLAAIIVLFVAFPVLAQPLWSENRGEVTVNQVLLDELFAKGATRFSLAVDGAELQVEVEKTSGPNLGVSSLRGRFKNQPESFFLLCRAGNGATIAFFQSDGGQAYRLDHTSGRDAVRLVDTASMGSCARALSLRDLPEFPDGTHPPAQPLLPADKEAGVADDGTRHDIIIGYTPAAEAYMGGYDFITAEIQLAVDAANLTYDNSLVNSQLRLVHTLMTPYEEISAWDYEDHAIYLFTPNDGQMDDMLELRNRVGADFVSVLIDGRDIMGDVPTCGAAPTMQAGYNVPEFEYLAVSVVSVTCAATNWSLAHEVGHNRGCAHNRVNTVTYGTYPYSHGLRFYYDPETDHGFRTVMAYDHIDGGYTRVPYFSNPEVDFAGWPTGIEPGLFHEAHNTLTQENTSPLCAGFRSERTFVEFQNSGYVDGSFQFPLPSIAQAIVGSRKGGHIVLNNSEPGFTGVLSSARSFIHEGPGSAVLGGSSRSSSPR
jgi:Metallo-peptidase family M12